MVQINEYGEIIREKVIQNETEPLWEEYQKLEYEVLNNHHNPTKDPIKIARYEELKNHFDIKKSEDALKNALKKAKEKLKQKIIASDESNDNSIRIAAIEQFKEKNE